MTKFVRNNVVRRRVVSYAAVLLSAVYPVAFVAAAPRLVVSVAIEGFQTDYMEAFAPLYGSSGFELLSDKGCVYTNVSFPFRGADRSSGMACLMTGTTPRVNGVVGCKWLNRETLLVQSSVDDASYTGWLTSQRCSPAALNVSTLADELKIATAGRARVVSIAPDADAAIIGAGHAADVALWIDDAGGRWCGTSYYGEFPAWALRYDEGERLADRVGSMTWSPVSPVVSSFDYFISADDGGRFTHKFSGRGKMSDFKTSALVNDEVTNLAKWCLTHTDMGDDNVTDFLALTYYAGGFRGQSAGDFPTELQDTYMRLDMSLAGLVELLDRHVGVGKYVLTVTSAGCAETTQADYAKYGVLTGRFSITRAASLLNMYLMALYGSGQYVEAKYGSQLFLADKILESKHIARAELLEQAESFLLQMSGVKDVYTYEGLVHAPVGDESHMVRGGLHASRSGDIYIDVVPGWTLVDDDRGVEQTVSHQYTLFPLFVYGCGVGHDVVKTPVTVDRLAPTLARLMHIRAPNACYVAPL